MDIIKVKDVTVMLDKIMQKKVKAARAKEKVCEVLVGDIERLELPVGRAMF